MAKEGKVISLFENQNEDNAYALALKSMVDKFSDDFPNDFDEHDQFEFSVIAWNLAVSKIFIGDKAMGVLEIEALDAEGRAIVETLSIYKEKKYKSYTNYIVDFDFNIEGNRASLSVETMDHSAFLEMMLDPNFEEDNDQEEDDLLFLDEVAQVSINRSSIFVRPKQAFINWLNKLNPDYKLSLSKVDEGTSYLYDEFWDGTFEGWLSINFDAIFRNELQNWHANENDWPQNRTLKHFKKWFSYDFASVVIDLEDDEIERY